MSVQPRRANATPLVGELSQRSGEARGQRAFQSSYRDLLPDPVMDELAEKLAKLLADRLADRIAGEIADLAVAHLRVDSLLPTLPEGATFATAGQLAARYQLSVQWVESRAASLGATPISDSANSKLRYHLATADAYMDARRRRPPPQARGAGGRKPTSRQRTHTRTGQSLLEVE